MDYDAVIVGAGFGGLYMLHSLQKQGLKCLIVEKGADVGGTWYHNRYPGARCDVESFMYSYQFDENLEQSWEWKARYGNQSEIQSYLSHVADRFDLLENIQFDCLLKSATWKDNTKLWQLETEKRGLKRQVIHSRFLITAVGCLSSPIYPNIPGKFKGDIHHTAEWPQDEVDYVGKSVGIIGTGSSAVQAIPEIAKKAGKLYVFQRTPNYVVPARQEELTAEFSRDVKSKIRTIRSLNTLSPTNTTFHRVPVSVFVSALSVDEEYREKVFEAVWKVGGFGVFVAFGDIFTDPKANLTMQNFIKKKILETVKDKSVAKLLIPQTLLGCKRPCIGSKYYETFNKPNVKLVDVKSKKLRYVENGLAVDEEEFKLDLLVTATGFDAMTGSLNNIHIVGKNGQILKDEWKDGPHTYLGLQVAGFPNLFTITGPASPSVLTNMVPTIEQHVEFVSDLIRDMCKAGAVTCEAEIASQKAWMKECEKEIEKSVYPTCNSWYVGANVPGKARAVYIYSGGMTKYRLKCKQVACHGYSGFRLEDKFGRATGRRSFVVGTLSLLWELFHKFPKYFRSLGLFGIYGPTVEKPKISQQIVFWLPERHKLMSMLFQGSVFVGLVALIKAFR